ncbi:MAG: MFS transporter [Thermoleophilia bacterium]
MKRRTASASPVASGETESDPFARDRSHYLIALFISYLGFGMSSFASTYIIYDLSGSVAVTGLLVVCTALPTLLLSTTATSVVNRWGGPKLYLVCQFGWVAVWFVAVVLSATGRLNTASMLGIFLMLGIVQGLALPTPGLVRLMITAPGRAPELNSAAIRNIAVGTVIGLILGGHIFAIAGPTWIFLLAALSEVPLIFAIYPLVRKASRLIREASRRPPITRERFRDLLATPRSNPGLRAAFICMLIACLIGSFTVTLPAIASSIGTDPRILSFLQAGSIVGGIFVALAARNLHGRVSWGSVQRVCYFVAAFGLGGLVWATHFNGSRVIVFTIALIVIIPVGFALSLDTSILSALVQLGAPADDRAAVFTGFSLILLLGIPFGQELCGLIADVFSVSIAIGAIAVSALLFLIVRPLHAHLRSAFDTLDAQTATPVVAGRASLPHASSYEPVAPGDGTIQR